MAATLLTNAMVTTGRKSVPGVLAIDGEKIGGIWTRDTEAEPAAAAARAFPDARTVDLGGKLLMAGGIDAHVHFREPGRTDKETLAGGAEAALKGGITSFVDMPNTDPPTVSLTALQAKRELAARVPGHWGFHLGATNDNLPEIRRALHEGAGVSFGGIKVFMGSSTGGMLVDRDATLEEIFSLKGKPILVHSEDEGLIRQGLARAQRSYGADIPFRAHPSIRSREACIRSTERALEKAVRLGTRLHLLHLSTAEEVCLVRAAKRENPAITAETSAHYLWFCDEDYDRLGGRLKCNPAVKTAADRAALLEGLSDGTIDTIGSDHAPHLPAEKALPYLSCPSGMPGVRHSLPAVLTLALRHGIPLTRVAAAFSENIARILGIEGRGRLETGTYADLVVLDPDETFPATGTDYRCGWTPFEGITLRGAVKRVYVDGRLLVKDGKTTQAAPAGAPLRFLPLP